MELSDLLVLLRAVEILQVEEVADRLEIAAAHQHINLRPPCLLDVLDGLVHLLELAVKAAVEGDLQKRVSIHCID